MMQFKTILSVLDKLSTILSAALSTTYPIFQLYTFLEMQSSKAVPFLVMC